MSPDLTVTEAAHVMVEQRIGALPVLEDGRLVGMATEGDLIMQDVKVEFPTLHPPARRLHLYPPRSRVRDELKKAAASSRRA